MQLMPQSSYSLEFELGVGVKQVKYFIYKVYACQIYVCQPLNIY